MDKTSPTPQTEEEFITGLFPSHTYATTETRPQSAKSTSTSTSSSSSTTTSQSHNHTSKKPTFDEQAIHFALRQTRRRLTLSDPSHIYQERKEARDLARKDATAALQLCHNPPARAVAEAQALLHGFEGGLEAAVKSDNVAVLKAMLVGSGEAIVGHRDADGATLLHICVLSSARNCLKSIVGLDLDIDAVDTSYLRMTPLITAARVGEVESCRTLLLHGANVRNVDCHGDSALHHAVREGNGMIVQVLLEEAERYRKGSTKGLLDICNRKGRSPTQLAKGESLRLLLARIRRRRREKEQRRKSGLGKLKMGLSKINVMRIKHKGKGKGQGKGKRKVKERSDS